MCGIAGAVHSNGLPVFEPMLAQMAEVLRHRGPDEAQIWTDGWVGLAHDRLSIIDLAMSHQPMVSADGRWALAFNGEIFNYRSLRSDLRYPFRTQGDTEVLLAGLALHGVEFVDRLRGQFAFAAVDRHRGQVHLVRDRVGILPLYYAETPGQVLFGSEIKAILAAEGVSPRVDLASLDAYLARRSVPAPDTLFQGIKKVRPGHRVVIDREGGTLSERYWTPPPVDPSMTWTSLAAVSSVRRAMLSAVEAAMVADVPVGAYLSGGVDSSLVVALMRRVLGDAPIETFSAGFQGSPDDELPWARKVSQALGTRHHEIQVTADDFQSLWPKLTWHRDGPMSEPADVAVFVLARVARETVRVVLSGEGGDELFAGYPKYRYAKAIDRVDLVPQGLRSTVVNLVEPRLGSRFSRPRIALRAVGATPEERLNAWFAPFTARERRQLLEGVPSRPSLCSGDGVDAIDRMLRSDLSSWLPDNLLERGDRMTMAASLELRPPLLDHDLVEVAFQLPSEYKVRRLRTKWVLKEVAREFLPREVVDRRKVGFRVPLASWFRRGLRDTAWDRLTGASSFITEIFDAGMVRDLLTRHETGTFNEESRLWTLMSLDVWHEVFFRGSCLDEGSCQ